MLHHQNTPYPENDQIPSIWDLIQTVRRHKKLATRVLVGSLAVGLVGVCLTPDSYRAYATLVLSDHNLNLNDFQDVTAGAKFDEMTVQTEIKILNSPALALQTIKATGLDKDPEFASSDGDEQEVVATFLKHFNVDLEGTSRALEISFKAHDPALAAKVTNAHAQSYLAAQVEFKKQQVEQLSQWFESKVKDLKTDVITKSRAVEDYRAKEGLAIGKDDESLIYQRISDVASQIPTVEVHKYDMQAKSESGAQDDVVKSPLIQNLKQEASNDAETLQSLRTEYGPNHPKVIEAQSELNQANQAIAAETKLINGSIKSERSAAASQETMLKARLDALNKQADDMREKTITLESLQIEADASKKILDNFLKSYENTQSQISFARPDALLVSPASIPIKAAPPGKKLLLLIAVIFSICMSLGVVFALEMMKKGLRNFEDIRKLAQRPLGIIPRVHNPDYVMRSAENSSYREALKRIYMSGLMNTTAQSILVTSAMPGEGRTTFVTSMAYYLLSLGHRVLVLDADFLRPSLSNLSQSPGGPGFIDVLTHQISISEAIERQPSGLDVMRTGSQALVSPDALRTAKLQDVLDRLKREYTYILIDSGPLLAHSEAGVIANQADGIIVVAEWLKTSPQNMNNMLATLQHLSTPILGVIINKVDIDKYKIISSGSDFLLPKAANAA